MCVMNSPYGRVWHEKRNRHRDRHRDMVKTLGLCQCAFAAGYAALSLRRHRKQAVRLGRRHNMPPPHLDFWPFDLEVGVEVACDLGYPSAKFRLPRPFGFRVRADVRDIRQTDRQTDGQTTDADHRLMPPPPLRVRGHNNMDRCAFSL